MTVRILIGDSREQLKTLPDKSVNMVVTSPPYYGLRDYDTGDWVGGDPACDHKLSTGRQGRSGQRADRTHTQIVLQRDQCGRCGAKRVDCQLGLEPTPEAYIADMVALFREIHRILRDDGTVWLNIGDSYAARPRGSEAGLDKSGLHNAENVQKAQRASMYRGRDFGDAKHKDMLGIPWMLAFALRADGWYLRQEIIWHKLNTMPESVRDRCTKSHEQIFLLAKSGRPTCWLHEDGRWAFSKPEPDHVWRNSDTDEESATERKGKHWRRVNRWQGRDYYFDQDAIMEPSSPDTHARAARGRSDDHKWANGGPGNQTIAKVSPSAGRQKIAGVGPKSAGEDTNIRAKASFHASTVEVLPYRNKRSVWTITSEPFPEAHFATYPPALIEPCILAGCPVGGTVLDPFFGAGTTGLVAQRLGRNAIGIELNPDYARMARRRIRAALGRVETDLPADDQGAGPLFTPQQGIAA